MKKTILSMAVLALGLNSCKEAPRPLEIDNSLSASEIEAGVFTPEVMWKMDRIGSASLSPDGKRLMYTVTRYNMEANRGVTVIVPANGALAASPGADVSDELRRQLDRISIDFTKK